MNIRRLTVVLCVGILLLLAPAALAATYIVDETTIAPFGNVDQTLVGPNCPTDGNNYCAPTATINSFTWLTNAYPGVYGNKLMGGQATWALAGSLLASATYMNTDPCTGTTLSDWINGKYDYIEDFAPGSTTFEGMSSLGNGNQPWVQAGNPTANFLLQMLQQGEDVELGILPSETGIGHVVTLSSINWNDANNNNVFDGLDSLTLDGLDPAGNGVNAAPFLWTMSPGAPLTIVGGAYDGYLLEVALAESPVPEPISMIFFGTGLVAVGGFMVRRRMKQRA